MTNAQTEARAIARCVRGCATDDQYIELVERIATALAAKDAELAAVKAELFQSRNFWSEELSAKNAQLAEAKNALEQIDALDEAMGHDLTVKHAFEAVNIARRALTGGQGDG